MPYQLNATVAQKPLCSTSASVDIIISFRRTEGIRLGKEGAFIREFMVRNQRSDQTPALNHTDHFPMARVF